MAQTNDSPIESRSEIHSSQVIVADPEAAAATGVVADESGVCKQQVAAAEELSEIDLRNNGLIIDDDQACSINLANSLHNPQATNKTNVSILPTPSPAKESEISLQALGHFNQERSLNRITEHGDENEDQTAKGERKRAGRGWIRHFIAVLALSSIVLANMNRQSFNQALTDMVRERKQPGWSTHTPVDQSGTTLNPITIDEANPNSSYTTESLLRAGEFDSSTLSPTTTISEEPLLPAIGQDANNNTNNEQDDTFDWDSDQIALLQAAFSWGYTPFMIPSGRLSEIYGAKWVVFLSAFGSAICCLLTPFLADNSFMLLVSSRILMGICQTGVSPALYAFVTRWLPPSEASVYLPMIKVSVQIGFMAGSLFSGFLSWRVSFYTVGLIGALWSLLWLLFASSDPAEHKLIGEPELHYIQSEINKLNAGRKQSLNSSRKAAAPWLRIITNPVVLAFIFTKFTIKLSTDAQTGQIPMYLKEVFGMPKEFNGFLNFLNYAIQCVFTGFVAYAAKECVVREFAGLTKTGVRRLFQCFCNFGMALSFILMTFNGGSVGMVTCSIVLLSVTCMFSAGGEAVLPIDLSTEFSASIMAIANSSANLSGIILPSLVKLALGDQRTSSANWNLAWWIVGGIIFSGGLVFGFGVEAKIQEFREPRKKKRSKLRVSDTPATNKQDFSVVQIEMKISANDERGH